MNKINLGTVKNYDTVSSVKKIKINPKKIGNPFKLEKTNIFKRISKKTKIKFLNKKVINKPKKYKLQKDNNKYLSKILIKEIEKEIKRQNHEEKINKIFNNFKLKEKQKLKTLEI